GVSSRARTYATRPGTIRCCKRRTCVRRGLATLADAARPIAIVESARALTRLERTMTGLLDVARVFLQRLGMRELAPATRRRSPALPPAALCIAAAALLGAPTQAQQEAAREVEEVDGLTWALV